MNITLASGSPRRHALLGLLLDDILVHVPNVDETFPEGPPAVAMEAVALRKAEAVASDGVVLAADTAVLHGQQVLGKSATPEDARAMLSQLNGQEHQVVTAVAVLCNDTSTTFHVATTVRLDLPPAVLDSYIQSNAWHGKAGSYGLQDALIAPHASIEGSWSNVVGLPLQEVCEALESVGVPCRTPPDEASLAAQNPF